MVSWTSDRKVVPYSMRVEVDRRILRTADERELFVANFNGAGADLLTSISAFVDGLPKGELVERELRHFGQPTDVRRVGRTLSWRMDGGESGRASSISLKKGGKQRQRYASGVEWSPFWVMATVPKDSNQGWLLIEKDGRYTLPTEWRAELIKQFALAHRGYRLVISTVREASLWSQVENALEEGRLVGCEVAIRAPTTTKSSEGAQGYSRGMVEVNRRIFQASGGLLPGRRLRLFRRNFTRQLADGGLREIDLPLEVDDLADDRIKIRLRDDVVEIKATVLNDDGRERTITFEGLDAQQYFVMTGTTDEPPSQDKFVQECRTAVRDLAKAGGVTLAPGWEATTWKHPADAPVMQIAVDENGSSTNQGL
ncbi:hypothetical protein [Rhodococcus sp. IEGM1428]|uniref:hypothetical protein n=1 Tax=Rhodococcus sp. IEGM1428 TaxID=3392191 RepID=UPI003D0DA022